MELKLIAHIWAENAGSHIEVFESPERADQRTLCVFGLVDGRETMIAELRFTGEHCADIVDAFGIAPIEYRGHFDEHPLDEVIL